MTAFQLVGWFARPAKDAAPSERDQVGPSAVSAPYVSRRTPAVPTVEVAVNDTSEGMVIRVKGEARAEFAGALLDGLLGPTARRPALVTLDLSELRFISSLAMGVLVTFRRSVVRTGGRVRLAEELQPAVKEALMRAELFDLFATDAATAPSR